MIGRGMEKVCDVGEGKLGKRVMWGWVEGGKWEMESSVG